LIRGSLQMGHPWPSAAQSASMPIAPTNQRQDSAFTHVAIGVVRTIAQKKHGRAAASLDSQVNCV
ncbi:hypothetical protein V2I80_27000, partial [Pseudomonas viridiflava]|uniref:hypothetical protein n=1 Tax=Pseudomonas viridiflava TaxID=33069 RepID=UPI002EB2C9AC|nr:hypothetical protein [Pseudomonas viridiflava]MEE3976302.1 hypothetical protein [Pseudomonas viridiflava]MEE4021430.1 hypothetical protein [Pseudomonas viridiflava]MEE4049109.1 hypothetical protein [Pseudomonas viridiflava]